jgi:hypothetical protein
MINGNCHIYMGQRYSTRRRSHQAGTGFLFQAARAIGVDPNQRTAGTPATGSPLWGACVGPYPALIGMALRAPTRSPPDGPGPEPACAAGHTLLGFGGPGGPTRRSGGRGCGGSNSHFGEEREELDPGVCQIESGCTLTIRGASDSSSVWTACYRRCGRSARVCLTSGAGRIAITPWPTSPWRRFRCFSCRARRFWPTSGNGRTGLDGAARTARRCSG